VDAGIAVDKTTSTVGLAQDVNRLGAIEAIGLDVGLDRGNSNCLDFSDRSRTTISSNSPISLKTELDIIIKTMIINTMTYEYTQNERIIELMGLIVSKLRRSADARLKGIGLTFPQYGTLFALLNHQEKSLNQRDLATFMKTDTTTIMVICDSLEKKGLLTRNPDSSDRRVNRITITSKGIKAVTESLSSIREVFTPVLSSITKKEAVIFSSVIEKMYRLVNTIETTKTYKGNINIE